MQDSLAPAWMASIQIRHIRKLELRLLEWEGEYIHFRRLFQDIYRRVRLGRALMWVVSLPAREIDLSSSEILIGQLFVQLSSVRSELADGRSRAYMHAFRIRPAYRNVGLGSQMLQFVEDDLRFRGLIAVTLNVARDNPDALRFYQRHGYAIVGPEPGRWSYIDHLGNQRHVNEPSWRMEKYLSSSVSED